MSDIQKMREVDEAFKAFSAASYAKYRNYNHAAGTYEALMSGLILGFHDGEYVLHRLRTETEELQK